MNAPDVKTFFSFLFFQLLPCHHLRHDDFLPERVGTFFFPLFGAMQIFARHNIGMARLSRASWHAGAESKGNRFRGAFGTEQVMQGIFLQRQWSTRV